MNAKEREEMGWTDGEEFDERRREGRGESEKRGA